MSYLRIKGYGEVEYEKCLKHLPKKYRVEWGIRKNGYFAILVRDIEELEVRMILTGFSITTLSFEVLK